MILKYSCKLLVYLQSSKFPRFDDGYQNCGYPPKNINLVQLQVQSLFKLCQVSGMIPKLFSATFQHAKTGCVDLYRVKGFPWDFYFHDGFLYRVIICICVFIMKASGDILLSSISSYEFLFLHIYFIYCMVL